MTTDPALPGVKVHGTVVVATPRPSTDRSGIGAIRERLRGAADGVRERAEGLRDRVTGADAERRDPAAAAGPVGAPAPRAPGTEAQPAFPWSTEEFVAGRDDADDDPDDHPDDGPVAPPAEDHARPTPARWDATDQIPDDELPWWRRPKDDR